MEAKTLASSTSTSRRYLQTSLERPIRLRFVYKSHTTFIKSTSTSVSSGIDQLHRLHPQSFVESRVHDDRRRRRLQTSLERRIRLRSSSKFYTTCIRTSSTSFPTGIDQLDREHPQPIVERFEHDDRRKRQIQIALERPFQLRSSSNFNTTYLGTTPTSISKGIVQLGRQRPQSTEQRYGFDDRRRR